MGDSITFIVSISSSSPTAAESRLYSVKLSPLHLQVKPLKCYSLFPFVTSHPTAQLKGLKGGVRFSLPVCKNAYKLMLILVKHLMLQFCLLL